MIRGARPTATLAALGLAAMPAAAAAAAAMEAGRVIVPAAGADGIPVSELSGLAWDEDARRLYAVSDRGYLYQFRLRLAGGHIAGCDPVSAAELGGHGGESAPGKPLNAEGLTLRHEGRGAARQTVLIVSLERQPPGILRFDTRGHELGELPVPAPAGDPRSYRRKGQGLEAVAEHPAFGIITAPESPLLSQPEDRHTLYASGRHWSFLRHDPDSRLKAIDVLDDGNLLVLERSPGSAKKSLVASLRRVDIMSCNEGRLCVAETLAVLPEGPDNFEGMTMIGPDQVLLVSDNGGKASLGTTFVLMKLR